jgi:hypothetical protein
VSKWRAGTIVILAGMLAAEGRVVSQPSLGAINGSASREARRPYGEYLVRVRGIETGQVAKSVRLDPDARFSIRPLVAGSYLVELVDGQGAVVCVEGPFVLSAPDRLVRSDVDFSCGKPPALWLMSTATVAGITAAVISTRRPASSPK